VSDQTTVVQSEANECVQAQQEAPSETRIAAPPSASSCPNLGTTAPCTAGAFFVFGSVAEGYLKPHSRFEVIVDFPVDGQIAAREFAGEVCSKVRLPSDVRLKSECEAEFVAGIRCRWIRLP
jgi:hypothetical protein